MWRTSFVGLAALVLAFLVCVQAQDGLNRKTIQRGIMCVGSLCYRLVAIQKPEGREEGRDG